MGYCPQTDPLIVLLTVRENLCIYAVLKGLHPDKALKYAELYAKKFEISQFLDTLAMSLSGGNKRKLCTAIAMMA